MKTSRRQYAKTSTLYTIGLTKVKLLFGNKTDRKPFTTTYYSRQSLVFSKNYRSHEIVIYDFKRDFQNKLHWLRMAVIAVWNEKIFSIFFIRELSIVERRHNFYKIDTQISHGDEIDVVCDCICCRIGCSELSTAGALLWRILLRFG